MRTTAGPQTVDVIYRRIDDAFWTAGVQPRFAAGRARPVVGVPQRGQVALVQCARRQGGRRQIDLPYVPDMIRFYLGQEPLLNNVQTWQLRKPDDLAYVLTRLPELVVKEVHGSGGWHADWPAGQPRRDC